MHKKLLNFYLPIHEWKRSTMQVFLTILGGLCTSLRYSNMWFFLGNWTKALWYSVSCHHEAFPWNLLLFQCWSICRLRVQDRCWVSWQVLWHSLSMLLRLPSISVLLSVLVSFILMLNYIFLYLRSYFPIKLYNS